MIGTIIGMIVWGSLGVLEAQTNEQVNVTDSIVEEFYRLEANKNSLTAEEYVRYLELSKKVEVKEVVKERLQRDFEIKISKSKKSFIGYLREEFLHPSRALEFFEVAAVVVIVVGFIMLKWLRLL